MKGRQPAITDLDEARTMLAKAEAEPAHAVTKLALRFLALTAVRPGVLIKTPWVEFDNVSDDVWCIPAARMKLKLDKKRMKRTTTLFRCRTKRGKLSRCWEL